MAQNRLKQFRVSSATRFCQKSQYFLCKEEICANVSPLNVFLGDALGINKPPPAFISKLYLSNIYFLRLRFFTSQLFVAFAILLHSVGVYFFVLLLSDYINKSLFLTDMEYLPLQQEGDLPLIVIIVTIFIFLSVSTIYHLYHNILLVYLLECS